MSIKIRRSCGYALTGATRFSKAASCLAPHPFRFDDAARFSASSLNVLRPGRDCSVSPGPLKGRFLDANVSTDSEGDSSVGEPDRTGIQRSLRLSSALSRSSFEIFDIETVNACAESNSPDVRWTPVDSIMYLLS